jgi:hypothetical protein
MLLHISTVLQGLELQRVIVQTITNLDRWLEVVVGVIVVVVVVVLFSIRGRALQNGL